MAFEGDLTNLGLADIFQTLGMNRQSGTLVVKYGETERRFYFSDDGVSLLTSRSARKFRLGNLLVGMGRLNEPDLRVAVLKQERAKETKLGDILIQTGLVDAEDIRGACRYQAAEEIYESFTWKSGKFQFLEGANAGPSGGPGPFAEFFFPVTDIVMEAARRIDEYALNVQKIGDQDEFYVRTSEEAVDEARLGRPAALLHRLLDGTVDVRQAFEDFYLSPFDTSQAFVALIEMSLVRVMGASDLQAAAVPFLDAKDFPRAARLLSRAARNEPQNGVLLQSLADAQAAAGLRKEAAGTLAGLGRLYADLEQRSEAIAVLRKAVTLDSRLEAAHELLMEVHASLDQFDRSESSCHEAVRILSEERDFEAALRLIDRGLAFVPESVNLRIQRANCLLAMGQRDRGMEEMQGIARSLDERKGDPRLVLGVYRKLLQLDPENPQFRRRVDELVRGEKAREIRRRLLRVGAVLGVAALAAAVWWLKPKSLAGRLEELEARLAENPAWTAPASAVFDEMEAEAGRLAARATPGSEEETRALALRSEIAARKAAPEIQARVKEIREKVSAGTLREAADLMKSGEYPRGIARALAALQEMKDAVKEIRGNEPQSAVLRVKEEVFRVLAIPADALFAEAKAVGAALTTVTSVEISKADDARQKEIFLLASEARKSKDRAEWRKTVDALAEAARTLEDTERIKFAELRRALDGMEAAVAALEEGYQEARAAVTFTEARGQYLATLKEVGDAKASGDVAKGILACNAFLARCDELRKEGPAKYFEPIVRARLFEVLKVDRDVRSKLGALRSTQVGLEKAREAEERGDIQAAFDLYRKTITDAQDVNFQGLVLLPVRITSRPPGATVLVTRPEQPPVEAGKTPFVLKYDYAGRTVIRIDAPGFEPAVVEREGIARDTSALVSVDLQRSLRWRREAGAAVEGRPGLAPGLVLVGTRGGLFRALSIEGGAEKFQLKTDHLSGISGSILVAGGNAYFGGNDGEAFAVDLAKQAFRWRRKTKGPVASAPALSGTGVAFVDSDGRVLCLRAAGGDQAWEAELGSPPSGDPLAEGGLALFPLSDGRVVALRDDGKTAWTARLSGPAGALSPDGRGGVLAATEGSTVERIDIKDGTVKWIARTDAPVHSRVLLRGGGALAVTTQGTLLLLDPATGAEKGRHSLGRPVDGGCALLGDTLYATGSDGALTAFDLGANRVLWVLTGLGQLRSEPVVAPGILVCGSAGSTGAVVALEP